MCNHGKKDRWHVLLWKINRQDVTSRKKRLIACTIMEKRLIAFVIMEKRQISCAITEEKQIACVIMEKRQIGCAITKRKTDWICYHRKETDSMCYQGKKTDSMCYHGKMTDSMCYHGKKDRQQVLSWQNTFVVPLFYKIVRKFYVAHISHCNKEIIPPHSNHIRCSFSRILLFQEDPISMFYR